MSLTLTVLSFKNQPIFEIDAVSIDHVGRIGRADDNTLVLPDTEKFVSRHHATISFENGCYYLSDTSLGGIYINNRETPLHNATERIDNGMILKIGEYEIAVAITDEQVADDFPQVNAPITPAPKAFLQAEEPLFEPEELGGNSLMTDDFVQHEELVQQAEATEQAVEFNSGLEINQSPLFDSYIAPGITPAPATEKEPENLSFDDLFSGHNGTATNDLQSAPVADKSTVGDFEALFAVELNDKAAGFEHVSVTDTSEPGEFIAVLNDNTPITAPPTPSKVQKHDATAPEKMPPAPANSALFNAFLQGAAVECDDISPERQTETLHRLGQMFRKLVDGTVAVLRSRAEFKSLCRVNMTVIKATDNNPLKFTVATDDVLRRLIENKTDGFLASTIAIEEAYNDIMNHQLAMQAGIQASLTDLLQTFDPKVIEKQFEQGIVLQKKAKCWDRYQETYRNTVDDAVENFFGVAFVKAYEKQMSQLTSYRHK